jgi:hypothetical protein
LNDSWVTSRNSEQFGVPLSEGITLSEDVTAMALLQYLSDGQWHSSGPFTSILAGTETPVNP